MSRAPCHGAKPAGVAAGVFHVAFAGNPNAGKTTLFNALTGIRAKTANFPGTTLEIRRGPMRGSPGIELVDLPGLYSIEAAEAEERVALNKLLGQIPGDQAAQAVILLLDATNLARNLFLASQILQLGLPTVVALTMIDVAEYRGMGLDLKMLSAELGCEVIAVTAKSGRGVPQLSEAIRRLAQGDSADARPAPRALPDYDQPADPNRYDWAERVQQAAQTAPEQRHNTLTATLDRYLTHRVYGLAIYAAVMITVFFLIFFVAQYPMGWIESAVGGFGELIGSWLPAGNLRSLIVDGMIAGVGGVVVFLPQICLIFFSLSLLEDIGYMARAALLMDRLMRRVGLPGKAFVPMLSAHACAIPAIMSTRIIDGRRDRLITILVLPLLTCSARLPVYAMVTQLLFPDRPLGGALLLFGGYSLGILAAVGTALLLRRTLLPGETQPLMIELPDFRRPSLRQALFTTYDRARIFVTRAGTVILAICIVLWWLSSYPQLRDEDLSAPQAAQIEALTTAGQTAEADNLRNELAMEHSAIGRMGHGVEPLLRPLGFDWRIGVGVLSSFAAREVVVSTLSILYGLGDSGGEDGSSLYERMRASRDREGKPVFTFATCMSLMVFFVLAMQCLPTQAVVRRETLSWRWPLIQLGYMTVLAYVAAMITYQVLAAFGKA